MPTEPAEPADGVHASAYGPPEHGRNPGDAWVAGDRGRFWGRFGAAGLLAWDPVRGILMQHRAEWSDRGGTWGLPGGALHEGEDAREGALREAHEEADVPPSSLTPRFSSVFSVGYWSYTTVVMRVDAPFEAAITDPESIALEWIPVDEVSRLELHPGFAAAWPALREDLTRRPTVVVDVANVVGARPDGWWKDRAAAAVRLRDAVAALRERGVPAADLAARGELWWPEFRLVVEGKASGVDAGGLPLTVVSAPRDGDAAIVDEVEALIAGGVGAEDVTVVTSDRELAERVRGHGATVRGSGWLWQRIDEAGR